MGNTGGVKHDQDKPRWDLLPLDVLEGAVRVLTLGAKKYGDWNWAKGIQWSRLYAALIRHLNAFYWWDQELDSESQLHHLDHALCELIFLRWMIDNRRDLDDRISKPPSEKEEMDRG